MIHQVLQTFTSQLNEYIRNELGLSEDMVISSSLMDISGGGLMQIESPDVRELIYSSSGPFPGTQLSGSIAVHIAGHRVFSGPYPF